MKGRNTACDVVKATTGVTGKTVANQPLVAVGVGVWVNNCGATQVGVEVTVTALQAAKAKLLRVKNKQKRFISLK